MARFVLRMVVATVGIAAFIAVIQAVNWVADIAAHAIKL
jgi:hypothetical protein